MNRQTTHAITVATGVSGIILGLGVLAFSFMADAFGGMGGAPRGGGGGGNTGVDPFTASGVVILLLGSVCVVRGLFFKRS